MNSAVIVAAGSGNRLGQRTPKQFIPIHGQEILSYSVNTFFKHPKIDEVIIVTHPNWMDHVIQKYPRCQVVKGGQSRHASSLNGVLATSTKSINVLIHDAARPFISKEIISNCLMALENFDGSAPCISPNDSLIKWDGKKASFLNRKNIQLIQTPQCFKKEFILNILNQKTSGTDEIGMVLNISPNSKLNFVKGNVKNNKITTTNDLNYFKKTVPNGP